MRFERIGIGLRLARGQREHSKGFVAILSDSCIEWRLLSEAGCDDMLGPAGSLIDSRLSDITLPAGTADQQVQRPDRRFVCFWGVVVVRHAARRSSCLQ
jgi:hypothetical protein